MEKHTGIVRNWFDQRGFGFIIPDVSNDQSQTLGDVFVHRNNLDGFFELYPGEAVSYCLGWNQRKRDYQAVAVARIEAKAMTPPYPTAQQCVNEGK